MYNFLRVLIPVMLMSIAACESRVEEKEECGKVVEDSDLLLNSIVNATTVSIQIESKLEESIPGDISFELIDFKGTSLGNESTRIEIKPLEERLYLEIPLSDINFTNKQSNYVAIRFESEDGSQRASDIIFFGEDSDLNLIPDPEIDIDIQPIISGYKVRLRSPDLVKNVKLSFPVEGIWSENCFVLLPGKFGEFYFSIEQYTPGLEDQLVIDHL